MNFFDGNGTSIRSGNEINTIKKQLKALQEQTDALSVAISDLGDTVSENKGESEQRDLALGENISINTNDINSLEENLENYKTSQAEITEAQVIRATEYIESPLHRIVETKEILESEIFGDEVKTKKIIINHSCSKKYIDIRNIPLTVSMISFNQGALKILIGDTMYSSQGYSSKGCICVGNNMIAPITYGYEYNDIYVHTLSHGGTSTLSLYFVMKGDPISELFIDYVITSNTLYTKEMFMSEIVESDEALYNSTQIRYFTKLENGYHTPYGYFYDKNGKIDTDIHSSGETITIGTNLGNLSFSYFTKGDIHTIGGKITTLSSIPSNTVFYGSLTKLTWKTSPELLQNLDLYIPVFYYNGTVQAYIHIETPSGITDDLVQYKATILGSLSSQETYYIGQTTFLA